MNREEYFKFIKNSNDLRISFTKSYRLLNNNINNICNHNFSPLFSLSFNILSPSLRNIKHPIENGTT